LFGICLEHIWLSDVRKYLMRTLLARERDQEQVSFDDPTTIRKHMKRVQLSSADDVDVV